MDLNDDCLLQNLAEFASKPVEWAWESFIPMGKLTLLAGDSGVGKSLVALQVAAMVTRGEVNPLPVAGGLRTGSNQEISGLGQAEERGAQGQGLSPASVAGRRPRAVVVLSAEDSTEDTVLPRLTAAGGDVSRVYVLRTQGMGIQSEGVESGLHCVGSAERGQAPGTEPVPVPQTFSLCRDWTRLQAALRQLKGAGVDVGLIVVDPIERFLRPSDTKKEKLAEKTKGTLYFIDGKEWSLIPSSFSCVTVQGRSRACCGFFCCFVRGLNPVSQVRCFREK